MYSEFCGSLSPVARASSPGLLAMGMKRAHSLFGAGAKGYSLTHDSRVCLSKIGSIKVKLHRPVEGMIKTCTIKYEAGQWYVIFSCEVEQPAPLPCSESEVGIDLGVTH